MKPPIELSLLPREPQHNPPAHIAEAARLFARLTGKPCGAVMTGLATRTRAQILQQAASAIMTQGNGQPTEVLSLLR